jgi:hypothetical protein
MKVSAIGAGYCPQARSAIASLARRPLDRAWRAATPSCDPTRLAAAAQRRDIRARDVPNRWESAMPRVQLTHFCAGLLVSVVGLALVLSSPANAERVHKKQGSYHSQRVAANANARRVKPQDSNAVYWGCCTKMGADPDPFIRSQILRDASGFFGGID